MLPRKKTKSRSCKSGQRKCNGKCISKEKCCKDSDCKKVEVCKDGRCRCAPGTRQCGKTCIPSNACCKDADCRNGQSCTNNSCGCTASQKACNGTCIPSGDCCADAECVGAKAGSCMNGSCVAGFQICAKPPTAPPVTTPGTATVTFVGNAESPGQSTSSAEFSVGSDGRDWVQLRSAQFAGVKLDDLEELNFTTYVPDGSLCELPPYLVLYVTSANGDDDILIFDQLVSQTTACDTWQTWDARGGQWRSIFHPDFASQQAPRSLDEYQDEFGAVTLRNQDPAASDCPGVFGGLRLAAGENNENEPTGGWQNFVGYVDSLKIKLAGQKAHVFNF